MKTLQNLCRTAVLLALALAALAAPARAEEPQPQWIVVTAPAFRDTLKPLIEQRQAQGLRVVVVPTTDVLSPKELQAGDAAKLREHVNKLCRDHAGVSYVLLAGAVKADDGEAAVKTVVPPLPGTASRMKGQPSDNGYGCPGEGLEPTVAVGRFPARSARECQAMVDKTLAFEKDASPGPWRRQLTVLAGIPAYSPVVDRMVERMAISRFDRIDPSWSGRALYCNEQSQYTLPEDMIHDRGLEMVKEGAAFTLYLGHSNAEGFWAGDTPFLTRDDWKGVKMARPGVFVTFGCNGCQLEGPNGEGYGVWAVRNPNGPAAAIGSHGICFAAMVELGASGLFKKAFDKGLPERLGEAWLGVKEGLAKGKIDGITFGLLDAVDGDGRIPLAEQRKEHLEMFLLLGDPALKLPRLPDDVKLSVGDAAKSLTPGQVLTVKGEAPARLEGAKVRLTLERPPGSTPTDLEPLPRDAKERAKTMVANYEKANRISVASAEAVVRDGKFEGKLETPKEVPWRRMVIRAYAATEKEDGQGTLTLTKPDE